MQCCRRGRHFWASKAWKREVWSARRGQARSCLWQWLEEPGLRSSCRPDSIGPSVRSHWSARVIERKPAGNCRIHRSLRGPPSAATSRQEFGAAMSRTQSTACGCRRDDAVAGARPGRDSFPPMSAADTVHGRPDGHISAGWPRNSVRSRHMLCSTRASLRATATSAFRAPIRSDKARPHMEIWDGLVERRSMTFAAS